MITPKKKILPHVFAVMCCVQIILAADYGAAQDLFKTAREGTPEEVNAAIKSGVSINQKDSEGNTPLHIAIDKYNFAVAEKLVHAGADINVPGKAGETPLILSIRKGLRQFAVKPFSSDAKPVGKAVPAIEGDLKPAPGQFDFVKFLLKNGADPKLADGDKYTPLHVAAFNGYLELVRLLVEKHGVNISAAAADGGTPLHFAVSKDYINTAKYLLDNGADVNAALTRGPVGLTPLMIAANNNSREMVKLLVSKGAQLGKKDANGKTALDYATTARNKEIEVLLKDAEKDSPSRKPK